MVHAVSLGEINATRSLVELLRSQRPGIDFIVSVTTETGFARGLELYGSSPDVTLVRYPLDFTSAVDRLLVTLRPAVVALLELEVWPNFIRRCAAQDAGVADQRPDHAGEFSQISACAAAGRFDVRPAPSCRGAG